MVKGVMLLVVGRLSDILGRRWFLIGGQSVAIIGSIISALAPNVEVLIGGTVLIAFGGSVALLFPLLCQEIVPNKYRGYSQALITLAALPFLGFGPVIGRSLVNTTSLGWRSVSPILHESR
jgi:MFS family permease